MLGRTDRRLRHLGLLAIFVAIAVALGARLSYWQLAEGDMLRQRAQGQLARPSLEFAQRGDITDRRGTLLATTAYRDLLAAYPDLLPAASRAAVATRLAAMLDFDAVQTADLVATFESGVPYAVVRRRLTTEQSQAVRRAIAEGELAALSLEPNPVRFYPTPGGAPGTTLASHLLGFVTEDGQGRYGIEQFNDALLAGRDSTTANVEAAAAPARAGQGVVLTIDASLQLRIEKELYAAWVANQAERVSAVIIDPRDGAVLAWASVPGYDANTYMQTARESPDLFLDPVASQIYEPGSVMKMITAAAALEAGVVTPSTVLEDEKFLEFGQFRVRNSDRRSMGELTFAEVMAYSRNVPTAKVAASLGPDVASASAALYDMWQRLGLGRPSGVEVSSEARGIAADPASSSWAPVDLANRSFGQGVAVTPMQLAVAYSSLVNGGHRVEPHVVVPADVPASALGEADSAAAGTPVLDAEVSRTVRELMINNVTSVPDVANATLIDGYTIGGKTGTAEYWDADKGRWADDAYNYTFCGFIGDGDPDVVIVVSIHKPTRLVERGRRSMPRLHTYELFRRLAQTAISVLDLPPDGADDAPSPAPHTDQPLPPDQAPAGSPTESPGPPAAVPIPAWVGTWERMSRLDE